MGLSLHQELSLYVDRCELTPLEALRSATSTTARRFRLNDRGKLSVGKRADILMVKGDPTKDIGSTLDIRGVWRGGSALNIDGEPVSFASYAREAPKTAEPSAFVPDAPVIGGQ